MALSLRISKEDEELFKQYAKMHNITVSDLIKESVLKRIEDELDLETYKQILKEYNEHPDTVDVSDYLKR